MKQNFKKILDTKNQLWISWESLNHDSNGIIYLKNLKFTGSVLNNCIAIEESGTIKLDLTHQYMLHIPKPYLVEFTWFNKIKQDKNEALFKTGQIKDGSLGKLSLLTNKDYLLLDCTDHTTEDEEKGVVLFNFYAVAFNSDKIPYNFTK